MLDRERFHIFQCVSRNNGSLSVREMAQVDAYLDNYPSYYMDGIYEVPFTNDCGNQDVARVDIRRIPSEDSDMPEFNP